MRILTLSAAVLGMLAVTNPVRAQGPEGPSLDDLVESFAAAPAYMPRDPDAIDAAINESLPPSDSVFLPSGGIGPLVKALLALEAEEGVLDRVRFRVSFGLALVDNPPGAAPLPVSLVQVDRFNLGPAMRDELVVAIGADNVAPAAEFGVGPDVSWRLVMRPIMGQEANIVAASRSEIGPGAAELCFGQPCTTTAPLIDEAAPWGEPADRSPEADVVYETERDGLPTPAFAAGLLVDPGLLGEAPESLAPGAPFLEMIIEVNLGQDASIDAAVRIGELMDDSVGAIWRRLAAVALGPGDMPLLFAFEAYECRRGDAAFAPPGSFCP